MDNVRRIIREKADEQGRSLSWLSRRIGHNPGYLYDFLTKKSPKSLPENERRLLAEHLGISEDFLRSGARPSSGHTSIGAGNILDGRIEDGRHRMDIRVFFEDTDFTQRVYHASYLRFMERGRSNYLRLIGANHRELFQETEKEAPGFTFVVRSMHIDFFRPAFMDDVLEIITEPVEVKGASTLVRQRVMRGEDVLVEALVRVAFISGDRARPIPKPLRIAMKADEG
jgi:acyl-CoA thioester hydrolase